MAKKRASAAVAYVAPYPAERTQHDRVTLLAESILDDAGRISQPYRVQSMLDRMVERSDITEAMRTAGERFNHDYRLSEMHPLRAADMQREVRHQGSEMGQAIIDARQRRDAALDALGGHSSPAGLCAWFVLGEELSVRDWAIREGWKNRPLREEAAKGILIGTLSALVGKYGL